MCIVMRVWVSTCAYLPLCGVFIHCWALITLHFSLFQFPHYTLSRNQMDLHEYKMHFSVFLSLAHTDAKKDTSTNKSLWYYLNTFLNSLLQHCLESVSARNKPKSKKCLQPWFICYYLLLLSTESQLIIISSGFGWHACTHFNNSAYLKPECQEVRGYIIAVSGALSRDKHQTSFVRCQTYHCCLLIGTL